MKKLRAVVFAVALLPGSPGFAAKIDLSKMRCDEFLKISKEDVGYTMAWLDAYYRGDDDPTIVDTDKFTADAKKLADYCAAHPNVRLITATDKVFEKD
ncbi:MAG TPA: HdeA/HdeB family chaperone [Xanthobacteraceae bacterium]